jgi:hypothetical protein
MRAMCVPYWSMCHGDYIPCILLIRPDQGVCWLMQISAAWCHRRINGTMEHEELSKMLAEGGKVNVFDQPLKMSCMRTSPAAAK